MELAVSAFTTIYLTAFQGHSTRRWATRHRALLGGALAIAGTALTLVSPSAPMLFATRLAAESVRAWWALKQRVSCHEESSGKS